jgi:hypothetical protein
MNIGAQLSNVKLCTDISEHMENYLVKKEVLSEKNLI